MRKIAANAAALLFGATFPAGFFLLAEAGAMELHTAFSVAQWSGLPLTGFYGLCAARCRGERWQVALLQAAVAALIGGLLIAFKALVH